MKKELRKQMLNKRSQLGADVRQRKSKQIVEAILQFPLFQTAQCVFSFVPFRDEADIRPLFPQALALGKKIAIPKTYGSRKEMIPYLFSEWDQLVPGLFGILEPDPASSRKVAAEEIDLILMPGVAFDREGGRLGYGGGFYDRFLAQLKICPPLAAICFTEQLADRIPTEEHDFPVGFIITDKEVIRCVN